MAIVAWRPGIFGFIRRYGRQHASPNSGYPESAMAGILNCRFGGTHVYHGLLVEKPYIGDNGREVGYEDFRKSGGDAVDGGVGFGCGYNGVFFVWMRDNRIRKFRKMGLILLFF